MPRSATCPHSQRNATTARASRTWWLSVHIRRWRPLQALRNNKRLPRRSAQGQGPTIWRRKSAPARLLSRAPPPPPRSRTHTVAPGPRGGGNPENSPSSQRLSSIKDIPEAPSLLHLPRTCETKMEVLFSWLLFYFFFTHVFLTSAAMATINGVRTCACDWLTGWPTNRLTHWPTDWLTDWLTDSWRQPPLDWWLQGMTVTCFS